MGIHYDYKSKRGERAMLKEAKRKERLALKQLKELLLIKMKRVKKLKCTILINQLLLMI